MKKIEAIIQPYKLTEVKEALADAGVEAMTVTEVRGHGRQSGHGELYRGREYELGLRPKMKIEIVVLTEDCDAVVAAIVQSARTGHIGDGKIFVYDIQDAVRIRTGNYGRSAI